MADFDSFLARFGEADGDRLFAALGISFAAFHFAHFAADEFPGLGGGSFALAFFGGGAAFCVLCRHIVIRGEVDGDGIEVERLNVGSLWG